MGVEPLGPFEEQDEVVRSATPAGSVASVAYYGPYGGLGAAHQAIRAWSEAHNHRLAGPIGKFTATGKTSGMPIPHGFARMSITSWLDGTTIEPSGSPT
jgi:hypothetical protein